MPLDLIGTDANPAVTADFSKFANDARRIEMGISNEWASRPDDQRFTSLPALIEHLTKRHDDAREATLRIGQIVPRLSQDGAINFEVGDQLLRPTHHSFSQLGTELKLPTAWMRQFLADAPDLVVKLIERAIASLSADKEVGVYHALGAMMAVTGPKYGRVFDLEVVKALKEACDESGAKWEVPTAFALPGERATFPLVDSSKEETTLYASRHDVCLFLVDQRNPVQVGFVTDPKTGGRVPDWYSRGIVVRNGECGGVALSISTFLYRWVCCNRSIRDEIGKQTVKLAHHAGVRTAFMERLLPDLRKFLNGSSTGIADEIEKIRNSQLVRSDAECLEMLTGPAFDFTKELADKIMAKSIEEDGTPIRTKFDAVQALTAAARSYGFQEDRMALERKAGDVISGKLKIR